MWPGRRTVATETKPSHPILRRIYEDRTAAQEQLLAGSPTDKTAEQVGVAYLSLIGRYRALVELEDFVRATLASGDDSD